MLLINFFIFNILFCLILLSSIYFFINFEIFSRYFQCKQNHGLFAPIEKVKLASTANYKRQLIKKLSDNEHFEQYRLNYINYSFQPIKLEEYELFSNDDNNLFNIDDVEADNEVYNNLSSLLLHEQYLLNNYLNRKKANTFANKTQQPGQKLFSSSNNKTNNNSRHSKSTPKSLNNQRYKSQQSNPTKRFLKPNDSKSKRTVVKFQQPNDSSQIKEAAVAPIKNKSINKLKSDSFRSKSSPNKRLNSECSPSSIRIIPRNETTNNKTNSSTNMLTGSKIIIHQKTSTGGNSLPVGPIKLDAKSNLARPMFSSSSVNRAHSISVNTIDNNKSASHSTSSMGSTNMATSLVKPSGLTKLNFQIKLNSSTTSNDNQPDENKSNNNHQTGKYEEFVLYI